MKNDKDTKTLMEIFCEKIYDYEIRSAKPIHRKVNINGIANNVKITRVPSGWKAEIFDHTSNSFVSADEFLSDIVLKKQSDDLKHFDNVQKSMPKL